VTPISASGMQRVHGKLELPFQHVRYYAQRPIKGVIYFTTIVFRRFSKHIVHDLILVSRMTDAHAQAVEILTTQMSDQVAQAVVTAMTTAPLQLDGTGRQIEFIVNNQDLLQWDSKKTRQRTDRLTTAVHKGHGFLQTALVAIQQATRHFAVELLFGPKSLLATPHQFVYKPKPGVMPGWFVLGTRITEPDDQLNSRHRPALSAFAFRGFITAFGCFTFFAFTTAATRMNRHDG
jgi:hypothetical protein